MKIWTCPVTLAAKRPTVVLVAHGRDKEEAHAMMVTELASKMQIDPIVADLVLEPDNLVECEFEGPFAILLTEH